MTYQRKSDRGDKGGRLIAYYYAISCEHPSENSSLWRGNNNAVISTLSLSQSFAEWRFNNAREIYVSNGVSTRRNRIDGIELQHSRLLRQITVYVSRFNRIYFSPALTLLHFQLLKPRHIKKALKDFVRSKEKCQYYSYLFI